MRAQPTTGVASSLASWLGLAFCLTILLIHSTTLRSGAETETKGSPRFLAASSTGWVEGESRWVSLPWLATEGIQDFRVTALSTAPGVRVTYQQETLDHAAPQFGPDLGANEVDVTMLQVSTTTATPESWELEVSASWEYRGRRHEGATVIKVTTISAVTENPLQPLIDDATVTASGDGTDNWVDLAYLGLADLTTNVEVSVEGDLPVQYTSKLFSSLDHGDELVRGEIDSARIWFDPNRLGAGSHELTVTLQYTIDASTAVQVVSHPLLITVE